MQQLSISIGNKMNNIIIQKYRKTYHILLFIVVRDQMELFLNERWKDLIVSIYQLQFIENN